MFQQTRRQLAQGELHVTADFGTHHVQESEAGKLPDLLVLVFDFLDAKHNEHVHAYIDCVPMLDQKESKDWCYVASVWDNLHATGFFKGYKKIFWWSDTGPNHFRTSNTLFYFREFQVRTGITMLIHFFAPYHGHSMCDGHIGAISRALVIKARSLHGSTQKWDTTFVKETIESLRYTSVTHHNIERTDKKVATLAGIKDYLVFTFDNDKPNTVNCAALCRAAFTTLTFTFAATMAQDDDLGENDGSVDPEAVAALHDE